MKGVEVVFHLACTAGNLPLDEAPVQDNGSAVGTLHVLQAALEAHVRRVLDRRHLDMFRQGWTPLLLLLAAIILTGCAVRGVETAAGQIAGVVTEKGRIACGSVVLAGGAW